MKNYFLIILVICLFIGHIFNFQRINFYKEYNQSKKQSQTKSRTEIGDCFVYTNMGKDEITNIQPEKIIAIAYLPKTISAEFSIYDSPSLEECSISNLTFRAAQDEKCDITKLEQIMFLSPIRNIKNKLIIDVKDNTINRIHIFYLL